MASRPQQERRLEAVFETPEQKQRCVAAATAIPMNVSKWAASVLLAAVDREARTPRPGLPYRGINSLRLAALQADRILRSIDDPALQSELGAARDLITNGLAELT